MKRSELFWMLVPCAFLAVMALWLRSRPAATLFPNEPFTVVVEKVEKGTLKPREVADGWDTKLKIVLTHKGAKPAWWGEPTDGSGSNDGVRLFHDNAGKQSEVKLSLSDYPYDNYSVWPTVWDKDRERYTAELLLPLAKVPPHPGVVKVQARFDLRKNRKPLCPPARLETVVRRAGEVVPVPSVSRKSYLSVERVTVDEVPPAHLKAQNYAADTRIAWKVRYYDTGEDITHSLGVDVMLYDEKGASYTPDYAGGGEGVSQERPTSLVVADFDLKKIPRSAGALTLRGQIGIGAYWPLKIEMPIRDKQGRVLKTPKPAAPFQINGFEVRPANEEMKKELDADVLVSIGIRFPNPPKNVAYENWQADWSPHLVDETGKQYWTFTTPYPVGPQPVGFGTSHSANDRHSIEYLIPLNQVPPRAKTVKFRTLIGYNHSVRLPVEVLLRKNGVTQFTTEDPSP